MKSYKYKKAKGYTLIELSVVIVLVMMIAATLISMLNQQVQYRNWWNTQKFIAEEAPTVNNIIVRLFSQADAFRVHKDKAQALAESSGDNAGSAVLLGYAIPGQSGVANSKQWGLIEYNSTAQTLEYSSVAYDASGVLAASETWTMASGIARAVFAVNSTTGIFSITLNGPYGGEVTYSVTPSL